MPKRKSQQYNEMKKIYIENELEKLRQQRKLDGDHRRSVIKHAQ